MTLEEILQLLGSEEPFLEDVEKDCDGYKQPFTDSGVISYGKLIDILYAVGNLTDTDIESIVETLDSIANEDNFKRKGVDKMLLPQELMAEQLWLLWYETYGVLPINKIEDLLHRCNLKLKKGKTLKDVRMAVGRGLKDTFGNMDLARQKIAEEIDKICIISRWDFAVGRNKAQ